MRLNCHGSSEGFKNTKTLGMQAPKWADTMRGLKQDMWKPSLWRRHDVFFIASNVHETQHISQVTNILNRHCQGAIVAVLALSNNRFLTVECRKLSTAEELLPLKLSSHLDTKQEAGTQWGPKWDEMRAVFWIKGFKQPRESAYFLPRGLSERMIQKLNWHRSP